MSKLLFFTIFAVVIAATIAAPPIAEREHDLLTGREELTEEAIQKLFWLFQLRTKTRYESEAEMKKRREIFAENVNYIVEKNKKQGEKIFGLSKFSDMSRDDFQQRFLNYKKGGAKPKNIREGVTRKYSAPTNLNWMDHKPPVVTNVKNQGDCGSCWAFSAVEDVESQWAMANHTLVELSTQQVVDCDNNDYGCSGGDTISAYEYIIKAGGLESEKDYPYSGHDEKCKFQKSKVVAKIKSYEYVTKNNNETKMAIYTAERGPISICVEADTWQFYEGGVLKSDCGRMLDHCVMITGYHNFIPGSLNKGYWIVRNSWGTDWGEKGFIYIEMGKDLCGISDEATNVIV